MDTENTHTEKRELTRRAFLAISAAATLALSGRRAEASLARIPELNMWTEVRRMISDGMLGTPYYASIRVSRARWSGDLAHVMARIDAVVSAGDAISAIPVGYDPATEEPPEHFMIAARYADGLACTIDVNTDAAEADTYVIRGEGGSFHLYDGPEPRFDFEDERDRLKLTIRCESRELR